MAGFKCPFCDMVMPVTSNTHNTYMLNFYGGVFYPSTIETESNVLEIIFYKCPNCGKPTIFADGMNNDLKDLHVNIYPKSNAIIFPDYIPQLIRNDYEEACAIVDLSPKASATLSRRCLQGMIRDFWGIKKNKLYAEIGELKDVIDPPLWKVLDGFRRLGNIGAHMEKDINTIVEIDPDEASKLLKLIEHLIEEWYIKRHEKELLYSDIIEIDNDKQLQRQS